MQNNIRIPQKFSASINSSLQYLIVSWEINRGKFCRQDGKINPSHIPYEYIVDGAVSGGKKQNPWKKPQNPSEQNGTIYFNYFRWIN